MLRRRVCHRQEAEHERREDERPEQELSPQRHDDLPSIRSTSAVLESFGVPTLRRKGPVVSSTRGEPTRK
jgi:hypothetical protein